MHYKSEVHASLVAEKSPELNHPVKVVSDDVALIHFENIQDKIITDINLNMIPIVNSDDNSDMKGKILNNSSNICDNDGYIRKNIFSLTSDGKFIF